MYEDEDEEDVTQNFTKANIGLLLEDDPGWKVSEALFGDFLQCCRLFGSGKLTGEQCLELVSHYEQLCEDQVVIMQKIIERAGPGLKFSRTVQIRQQVTDEKCSWRLFRMLLQTRLSFEASADRELILDELSSDLNMLDALVETDKNFRELKVIIDWCQQNIADQLDDSSTLEHFRSKTFLWENTLHNMKQKRSEVCGIDPDAPLRFDKCLDREDAAEEKQLITVLFGYIRCGQLEKAYNLCRHCGQAWRAATLQGCLVSCDLLVNGAGDGRPSGNKNRDLWKALCWKMSDSTKLCQFERAIYAALSGQLSGMLPVCYSWEDRLWAYCIAVAEGIFDKFLRSIPDRIGRPTAQLASSPADEAGFELDEIFKEVEATDDEKIKESAGNPYRVVQKMLMLNDYAGVIEGMHRMLGETAERGEEPPRHLVRFIAHLVMIFRQMDVRMNMGLANGILEFYVRQLIEDGRGEEVSFYSAILPSRIQIELCAAYLEGVFGTDKRKEALINMEKSGLNVFDICKEVVENIRLRYLSETPLEMGEEFIPDREEYGVPKQPVSSFSVEERDDRLAGAVEFLLFHPPLRLEALRQANSIARIFLISKRAPSAYRVLMNLPAELKNAIRDSEPDSVEEANTVKENICLRSYLEAHDAFGQWFKHYYSGKPTEPESVDQARASFTDKAVNEQKQKQYQTEKHRWEHGSQIYSKSAINALNGVLLFPGGWMVDETLIEDSDSHRQVQMEGLRKLCVPLVAAMLVTVYRTAGNFREAMQMAETIASKNRQLYKVFSKSQLQDFVQKLGDCSVEALDAGLNCVGC